MFNSELIDLVPSWHSVYVSKGGKQGGGDNMWVSVSVSEYEEIDCVQYITHQWHGVITSEVSTPPQ